MQCTRWCRADTLPEDLTTRCQRLVTLLALTEEETSFPKSVQFRKPLGSISDERLQEDSLCNPAHANLTTLKAKLARQAHCLAASIAEKLGDSGIRHGQFPPRL